MRTRLRPLALVVALAVTPSIAAAQNAVINGSFETGDFAGWTLSDVADPELEFGVSFGPNAESPFSIDGDYEAFAGPVGQTRSLSQVLTTMPGTQYLFSFWLDNILTDAPNSFAVSWNGTVLATLTDFRGEGYTRYSYRVEPTAAQTMIEFTFRHDDAFWYLDDVRADVVPEPATMALLATGLVGLAATRRRARRQL